MDVWAKRLRSNMGDDLREDLRGAVLDRADNAEPHAAGEAAPGTIRQPRLTFAAFFTFAVALAQGACWKASALGLPPPAGAGQSKAPQDGCIFVEQNALATTGPVFQGGEFEMGKGKGRRVRSKPSCGTAVVDVFF
jgi:hypothetical protein